VIDSETLARLVALGQQKGHLTNQDLADALPVATMSADDIALVVVHLEDAGVSVDLDETLLARASTGAPMPRGPAEILPVEDDAAKAIPKGPEGRLSEIEDPPSRKHPEIEERGAPSAHRAVILAIILVLLLAVLAFILGR
jgi:hypothetical protein